MKNSTRFAGWLRHSKKIQSHPSGPLRRAIGSLLVTFEYHLIVMAAQVSFFHKLDEEVEMIFGPRAHQYVIINCALNTSQHIQAGAFATHLARAKPVACWKASQSTGDSTLLQLQMSTELASEIYNTPRTKSLSIRNRY